jgi:hypothetical protein
LSASISKDYDDNRNHIRSELDLVKELIELLSITNAAAGRIASGIDKTLIQEVKQTLKKHLNATGIFKKLSIYC